jgi:beta-glucan synthesis-associated protein KRE6
MIDPDTDQKYYTKMAKDGKTTLNLVVSDLQILPCLANKVKFSDEFNQDGRTFYDGDDPYFQAVDLWYGVTADLEVCMPLEEKSRSMSHIVF